MAKGGRQEVTQLTAVQAVGGAVVRAVRHLPEAVLEASPAVAVHLAVVVPVVDGKILILDYVVSIFK